MTELEFKILLNEKLCDVADAILFYYNPCQLNGSKCLQGDASYCCLFYPREHNGECKFLKEDGCHFRNIKCKTWLCETAIRKNPECVEALKVLESLAKMYGLARRPFLGERYVGKTEEVNCLNNQGQN